MTDRLWRYRLAGAAGGLMMAAGNFFGSLCLLQLGAFIPLMIMAMHDKRPRWSAMAGLYMGIAFAIPQMISLRMPLPVTVILLVWFTLWLIILCTLSAVFVDGPAIVGCFAFGAAWFLADWLNYTLIPVWGMAQSFARGWTAYPFLIGFISITGISGVLFVIGTVQALAIRAYICPPQRKINLGVIFAIVLIITSANITSMLRKPAGSLHVAAAGWIFDDREKTNDPHTPQGFHDLFAAPAAKAAKIGARIFTTGELGFYIADHDRDEWMAQFSQIAKENNLYLVVGYFNITANENRIFFMNPQGQIETEYTKTHLTPFEQGKKGSGDLKTMDVDGIKVGAMICQDDNFSRLTCYYGRFKTPLILCPTADWWTIKDAHLQAVRARAIECHYAIARSAANGISAIISPTGEVIAKWDHYRSGAGFITADIPLYNDITPFARFGHWPMVTAAALTLVFFIYRNIRQKKVSDVDHG